MTTIKGNMLETGEDGRLFAAFESIPAVFKKIDEYGWEPAKAMASDIKGDGDYLVFENLEAAHHVFRNEPWRIRQFSQKDDKMRNEDTPGNDIYYDVTGDYVDVGRFLEGEPEDFGNSILGNPARVFCDITVNIAAAKWTTAEYIVHKQRRILRLVDWLEQYGIRCRVRALLFTEAAHIYVTIKEQHDPFDLNHLAISMHPDFLRRTCFMIMEQSDTWEFGYGDAVTYDDRTLGSNYCDPDNGITVYVGGYMPYAPKDTPHGYTYENDTSKLDRDFDKIEKTIAQMIQDGTRFTEVPLKVGRPFMTVKRNKRKGSRV